ncbi:MAG TPA: NAD(P)H-dependent oxidoreductase [Opitutaceae bacterium]|nr:NAD(P)H-dependent oxidoreductase [Opitutaceae bacterium]
MSIATPSALLTQLNWRYATKKFDPSKKIAAETWAALEQVLILTPSSYGLQPWRFVVITDQALRETLRPLSWGQAQVTDCSHYVIFARRNNLGPAEIAKFVDSIAAARNTPRDTLKGYEDMMVSTLIKGPRNAVINEWAARQLYIALGNFMTSAAVLGIDTCPMEGIDAAKYDEVLGLPAKGFSTVVACAAGHRAADDKYATHKKVRFSASEVIEHR